MNQSILIKIIEKQIKDILKIGNEKLPSIIEFDQIDFKQEDFKNLGENGVSQIKILTEKAKEAGGVAQEFVQEAVRVDENGEQNISEKAFEYGKYIYCQEVVKQYEASRSSTPSF
ncbi:MAG: hypothetical protein US20_C0012G0028 [Candidatus Pacebacteria bacterium GW2011_GWF1_36_5]|nr:MAG: hypothetical protein US20_C0012G0028 [Candidatus Pacebacteria bacterium GW2011_GWF1_36_5]